MVSKELFNSLFRELHTHSTVSIPPQPTVEGRVGRVWGERDVRVGRVSGERDLRRGRCEGEGRGENGKGWG